QYIENAKLNPQNLHKKIVDNIVELKSHFAVLALTGTKETLEGFTSLEEKLSWMLFVDGCSLLHILEHANLRKPDAMNIKIDQLVVVMMDVLLLENQLPYLVLTLTLLWKNEEAQLIDTMKDFLKWHHWSTPDNKRIRISSNGIIGDFEDMLIWRILTQIIKSETPTHLLDLQRKIILTKSSSKVQIKRNR
ncbi:DUF247 domain protein, partial [Trifolium medium]|nr:DUF247 domain protein [Trifolium medium]